jgi:hypothetical protein
MFNLRIPVLQFRSFPDPTGKSKLGLFYARASAIPRELWDWREVNPRDISDTSAVYQAISYTLTNEPDRFFERNRGLTISADEVTFDEKRKEVLISLRDHDLHGLVDGGHTLHAILEAQRNPPEDGWPAFVFLKIVTGVEADQIAEIAGGLNRSQQVDLKSLVNLKSYFDRLKKIIENEPYAGKIAYRMNEDKPIDVREVLYYLAVFDCNEYDQNKHPTRLFGRKEGIVRSFAEQADPKKNVAKSFDLLISRAPDILKLRDLIEKKVVTEVENIGHFKPGKKERIKSKKHKKNELHFLAESIDGKVPLGWIMPMLGAFRANVVWDDPAGSFSWKVPNEKLLKASLQRLVSCIQEIHTRENSRPEYVGRSGTAWRLCYETVQNTILEEELKQARVQGAASSAT